MTAGCAFATNDPAAVVEAAHRSGAVCLLAHPGRGDGYAQRHHLVTSAGSDSHGLDKPPVKYRAELSRGLLERVGIQME